MTVSGFSFVRNGITFDYPFVESISSLLPLCDEFVIAVGKSQDETLDRIHSLKSPKLKIIETVWDDTLRSGGSILAQQTNRALDHVKGDWAIYLQADEVLHENDLQIIRTSMEESLNDKRVEGLLFGYRHFYGSYNYVGDSRRWYRREVRAIKPSNGVRSWGDAQGFRIGGRKLTVRLIPATVYHYGWVKPPAIQQLKQKQFNKLWHSDEWVQQNVAATEDYDYSNGGRLARFEGTHPAVMQKRVEHADWDFRYDPSKVRQPFGEALLDWIERRSGYRLAEYRNYNLI
ncbi:MAG: glycosyltransferase family 2 protein [Bacteroidota bacterium]